MDAQVFAWLCGWHILGHAPSYGDFILQHAPEGGRAGRVGWGGVVKDPCHLTFVGAEGDACPGTVGCYLGALQLQVFDCMCHGSGVIGIP